MDKNECCHKRLGSTWQGFIADVASKSFDGDGIANLVHADDGINSTVTFNISGKVIVDGYTTQANTKVDAIEFTLTQNGKSMTVKGFRKTGWEGEDY